MAEKIMGIYFIQNEANGKRYIGSSADIKRRLTGHMTLLRKGKHVNIHLSRAWAIDGEESFTTGVCEIVTDLSILIEREQVWIDAEGHYNLAPAAGSTLGFKQSDEFKANQSKRVAGKGNPMYGTKRPEVGEIMRATHTGRVLTEEHKKKCSDSLKGKGVGIPLSDETKAKIGAANKGRVPTPAQREKMATAQQNRPPISEITREKLRVSSASRTHSDETKEKIGAALRGKKLNLSDSERACRAERAKKRVRTVESRKAQSERQLGVPRPAHVIAKMSETMRGKKRTDASRAKQSESCSGAGNHRFGVKMSDETKRRISETKRRNAEVKRVGT